MKTLEELSESKENSITLLRLIAALAVIYGHSYAVVFAGGRDWVSTVTGYAHAGGVAVDFFFLLSGFLVTGSLLKRGALSYIVSRSLRLFPALWVYLLVATFVLGPVLTTVPLSSYFFDPQTYKYLMSLGLGWSTEWFLPGVFEQNRSHGVNGSIWSVILEIRMYLYLLLMYALGVFSSRLRFNSSVFALVILVWSGTITVPGVSGSTDNHVALLFCVGSLLYVNRDLVTLQPLVILSAFALAAVTHNTDKFQYAYIFLLICLFCIVAFIKNGHYFNRFGDYSYGVYLWGWPVQQVIAMLAPDASALFNAGVSMLVSLFLAILSWHLVEKRALELKPGVDLFLKKFNPWCVAGKEGSA